VGAHGARVLDVARAAAPAARRRPYSRIVMPTTSWPCSTSSAAAVALSTPPDSAATTSERAPPGPGSKLGLGLERVGWAVDMGCDWRGAGGNGA
jgi:hypothetical protein